MPSSVLIFELTLFAIILPLFIAAFYTMVSVQKKSFEADEKLRKSKPPIVPFVTNHEASRDIHSQAPLCRDPLQTVSLSRPKTIPCEEAVEFFKANEDRPCRIAGTNHRGYIYGLNTDVYSICPPKDYPILVKITESPIADLIDRVLEYKLESIEILQG